jgi:LacI family transcriptional regulator, galactose operon repressor
MAKTPEILLLIEKSREYGRGLLRGIARYSNLHGPWGFYRPPRFYRKKEGAKEIELPRMNDWAPDGIIMRDLIKIEAIADLDLPIIIAYATNERTFSYPVIMSDCSAMGEIAAEYLHGRGLQQFAYCGFDDMPWSRDRHESFQQKIAEAGFEIHSYKPPKSRIKRLWQNEQKFMADWLKSLPKPIGLMACNDDRGQDVLHACKIAGLDVPDDIAVLGVDNDELICNLSEPPLTSIALNTEKAGYEAAELLDKLMSGKEKMANQTIMVRPTHVVTRRSTEILAIEDREVIRAVRYIRQYAKKAIQVTDVVDVTNLSRRVLEKRFSRVLGRSILKEIRHSRVNQIAKMLVETNQSILQIALSSGFSDANHISRYFQQEKGISPIAYRKQHYPK